MPAANIEDFCEQLCKLLSLEPPPLTPDANGRQAFTLSYRATEFSFLERKDANGAKLSMLVKFGTPPADKAGEIFANMLMGNFMMLDKGASSFVMEPGTFTVYLHRSFAMSTLHAPGVHAALDSLAAQAARWPNQFFQSVADSPRPAGVHFADLV